MSKKTALIAGSSGLIGGELIRFLLEAEEYDEVIAIVRKPLKLRHPKLTERVVHFDQLEAHQDIFAVDDVFCCLGTTIKKAKSKDAMSKVDLEYPLVVARLAREKGAKQVLVVTAMGANTSSSFWYSRLKGRLEQELMKISYESISILRPSLLLGNREEFRLGERIAGRVLSGLSFLFKGPLSKYRAIQGKTVAFAMYKLAQMNTKGVTIYSSEQIEVVANQ